MTKIEFNENFEFSLSSFPIGKHVDSTDKTVVVGMSGGVDSSVTALVLKKMGFRVVGIFMRNWEEKDENGNCTSEKDFQDVAAVCTKLDIPFQSIDFVKEYRENVFQNFLDEYKKGRTPNPDILCNREIKFKVFFDMAMKLGADFLATGHYCQTDGERLLKGVDPAKDQSYFLHAIDGTVLDRVIFPLGGILKSQVRQIAKTFDIPTFAKKDSTGICFIGERNFREFLQNYLAIKPGEFQTLDGTVVGKHHGVAYYTLGQRRKLGLGGPGERWFVVKKSIPENIVYVERGIEHSGLYADELEAVELTEIKKLPKLPFKCKAKIRYRQQDQNCTIYRGNDPDKPDNIRVEFDTPQRAIAEGQSIVFYQNVECLGGALIEKSGPTYFDRNLPVPELAISENSKSSN